MAELSEPPERRPPDEAPPPRVPRPGLNNATLYLRDANQYLLVRDDPKGGIIFDGYDGRQSWRVKDGALAEAREGPGAGGIPMKLKKRAGRKEIVLPKAVTGNAPVQEALVRAVARAWKWQSLLESGEVASIIALATRFHVDHSYVARTLRLASLAPDIVEMIIAGDEPSDLFLRHLMKGFSVGWGEQREELCGEADTAAVCPSGQTESPC